MALYNLSQFIKLIKSDIAIRDIPLPITDNELIDRFDTSALTDFSIVYPRLEMIRLSDDNIIRRASDAGTSYTEYKIPPFVYLGSVILGVSKFDVVRPSGYSDFYMPNANWSTPDAVIAAMADLRLAAGVASSLAKAPTYTFKAPDRLLVYNSWTGGVYEVELLLKHDLSLATIQPSAFPDLRRLTVLDTKMFLYNELKRKDSLDVGIGTIQLRIDDWASAESDRQALLDEWKESAYLDFAHIRYF